MQLFLWAAVQPVVAQPIDEARQIHVRCNTTGLFDAALGMARRTGAVIDFERVPRVVEGSGFRWVEVSEEFGGGRIKAIYSQPFEASFSADASPEVAMRAIVDQWNATPGVDARYRLVAFGRRLDFVPVEVLGEDGVYHPYTSVLDVTVRLPTATGQPDELSESILAEWEVAAHGPIGLWDPYLLQGEPIPPDSPEAEAAKGGPDAFEHGVRIEPIKVFRDITLVSDHATARILLHDLLEKSLPRNRSLMISFLPDVAGWGVLYPVPGPNFTAPGCTFSDEAPR